MYQEISVIHQDPLSGLVSFHADRKFAGRFERLLDLVAHRVTLPRIGYRADDEEIRK